MSARKQSLVTTLLDWIVPAPEGPAPEASPGREAQVGRAANQPVQSPHPATRDARGDNNLFALLCRLTC